MRRERDEALRMAARIAESARANRAVLAEAVGALEVLLPMQYHHWRCPAPRDPGDACNCPHIVQARALLAKAKGVGK